MRHPVKFSTVNHNNSAGEGRAEEAVAVVSWRSWGMELGPEGLGGCGVGWGVQEAEFQEEELPCAKT